MAAERLQKIIARAGVTSRRAAEELITAGRVRVNGRIVRELGTRADGRHDRIEVDGRRLVAEALVYLVLHKPRGVVSTLDDPEGRPTVRDLVRGVSARVYPIGRLDFNTSGVLLLTNDGDFYDGLLHPKRRVPKTYIVKVSHGMSDEDLARWRKGVELEDGRTAPADVALLRHEAGKTWIQVTLFEGRNQQIRRMGEATGFPVMRLARVAFAGITAEGLRPGGFRELTPDELIDLRTQYGVPKKIVRSSAVFDEATANFQERARGSKRRIDPRARRAGPASAAGSPRAASAGSPRAAGAGSPRPANAGPPRAPGMDASRPASAGSSRTSSGARSPRASNAGPGRRGPRAH